MEFTEINNANYPQIAEIYLEGIKTGTATFETNVPVWEKWDTSHLSFGRIALEDNDQILGWASLSSVSSRRVYDGVAEVSVYVTKNHWGKGFGKLLLNKLIEISEQNNIWTLQSGIMPANEASIKIHLKCGFRKIGLREKIAKLHDVWLDNVILERRSKIVGVN